jgi:ribosome-associated protein
VEAAGNKQASDIILLDTSAVCSFADYFLICSGESSRQINAIIDEIRHVLKKEGILPHHYEGTQDSGWFLLDFGDITVHVFSPEERERYQLEELWSNARTVLRIQ